MTTVAGGKPRGRVGEVAWVFLKLGMTSFGGPIAHTGYFHSEIVQRRRWIDAAEFADLVALCQFLPGPASSQLAFALGKRRAGWGAALAATLCFLLPSALLMIGLGVAAVGAVKADATVLEPSGPLGGVLQGLKLAAVADVAHAVWTMWRSLCPDPARKAIAVLACLALVLAPAFTAAWMQVVVIAAGAALGWGMLRPTNPHASPGGTSARAQRGGAVICLAIWLGLLIALGMGARVSDSSAFAVLEGMYRSGSLVFGGGHVVLPLLHAELVATEYLGNEQFVAGYGAAQAMPGPLFSFAGYLGAIVFGSGDASILHAWAGGGLCLLAIFLPGWLLVAGAMPIWDALRSRDWARSLVQGSGAAVVGVLAAALYTPLITHTVRGVSDAVVALLAIAALAFRTPPIVIVIACACAGYLLRG